MTTEMLPAIDMAATGKRIIALRKAAWNGTADNR